MKTILTKNQKKYFSGFLIRDGTLVAIHAEVHHDDRCNNGHNTFSITGEIPSEERFGCIHKEIAEAIPMLAPFIKWHLTSTDEPMHYIANTIYHVKQGNLDFARSTAVWPDATDSDLLLADIDLTATLKAWLPALMVEFQAAVESLGFVY